MSKRIPIKRPPICYACRGSTGGVCANHAPKKKSTDPDVVMWEECDGAEKDATSWECSFLESLKIRMDEGLSLTPAQRTKLEEIHARLCGGEDGQEDQEDV